MAGLSNSDREATNFSNPSSRFPKITISETGFGSNMVTSNRCHLFWHARAKESCSSAGPTASGRPLEPQVIILLLSEQEAQDPAGPANVRQPLVAETRKCNVRSQLCRQPQAAHSTALLEELAAPASTMWYRPSDSSYPAQHVPLLHMTWRLATQTKRPV